MIYKKEFKSPGFLSINVKTNSLRVLRAINNHLAHYKDKNPVYRRCSVSIYFKPQSNANPDKLVYQSLLYKGAPQITTVSPVVACVKADSNAGFIKSVISDFKAFKENLFETTVIQPMRFILAHDQIFFLHASAASKAGKTILFSGPQDCGKTTLALYLAMKRGFDLLTDDKCFIRSCKGRPELLFMQTSIGIGKENLKRHPLLSKKLISDFEYGGKKRFFWNKANRPSGLKTCCDILIFPVYKDGSRLKLKRLTVQGAVKKLTNGNLIKYPGSLSKKLSVDNFWAVWRLAANAGCFELSYNDKSLNKCCDILEKLL